MLDNIKMFRDTMDNFARSIQFELKLLDINDIKTRSKTSSNQ